VRWNQSCGRKERGGGREEKCSARKATRGGRKEKGTRLSTPS